MDNSKPMFPAPQFGLQPGVDQKTIIQLGNTLGITHRQWLAGIVLSNMIPLNRSDPGTFNERAKWAYKQADAMLKFEAEETNGERG